MDVLRYSVWSPASDHFRIFMTYPPTCLLPQVLKPFIIDSGSRCWLWRVQPLAPPFFAPH